MITGAGHARATAEPLPSLSGACRSLGQAADDWRRPRVPCAKSQDLGALPSGRQLPSSARNSSSVRTRLGFLSPEAKKANFTEIKHHEVRRESEAGLSGHRGHCCSSCVSSALRWPRGHWLLPLPSARQVVASRLPWGHANPAPLTACVENESRLPGGRAVRPHLLCPLCPLPRCLLFHWLRSGQTHGLWGSPALASVPGQRQTGCTGRRLHCPGRSPPQSEVPCTSGSPQMPGCSPVSALL